MTPSYLLVGRLKRAVLRAGAPFVGPAGRLLDHALGEAGIGSSRALVTNAVEHFNSGRVATGAEAAPPPP